MCIKDFFEMSFQGKDFVTVILSGAAFTISFFNYRRDNGQMLLSVSIGKIVSISAVDIGKDALYVSLTNTGRRNIFVKSIIFNQSCFVKRFLQNFFPSVFKAKYAMWMPGNKIPTSVTSLLYDSQFRPQKYTEGESQNATIPLDSTDSKKNMLDLFNKSKSMFVEDTTGRKHYLSSKEFRKVIFDLKNMTH